MINHKSAAYVEILDALASGVTVITANKRLARVIRLASEETAMGKGLEAWPTPDVLSWAAWLQRNWEEASVSGATLSSELLLSSQQEQRIWEDIIAESVSNQPLQQITGTVRRVQEAWQLTQSWQLPLDEGAFNYNSDSEAFWLWASRFEAKCAENAWLPMSRLPDEIQQSVESGALAMPRKLVFIGFDEMTPQQRSFLKTLVESGCDVWWTHLEGKASRSVRVGCADVRQEAETIARWVRQRLEENPKAEIGIVVPKIASKREILIHALDGILMPHAQRPGHHAVVRPYNISLGPPLSGYPIIATALKLLGLLKPTISLEDSGRLLSSPFIAGWKEEASARALLDGRLRETGELDVALETLRDHASQTDRPYSCPILVENTSAWVKGARDSLQTGSPGKWSERFSQLLKAIGWAHGRPLSSEEYQAVEAWRELLSTFSSLEQVTGPMSESTAVAQLRHMAGERTFQPETGSVPVQVLGLLEASGLQFAYLWVMGLHDGVWPEPPQPNPFIPLHFQRDAGLPHSSEERELHMSRTITRRLLTSANDVIMSFPQRNGDEALRPSPLIRDLSRVAPEAIQLWQGPLWREVVHDSAKLTTLEEGPAPSLENEEVRGGSTIFKLQAACPFRAFAELRLGARPLSQADIGLDTLSRGSLMHRVLEKVWHVLDSQGCLIAMDVTQLEALVETKVDESIDEMTVRYPQILSGRFRKIEAKRLSLQVLEWLKLEEQRVPFRVVEKEGKHETTAGGIRVQLKVDRIDELADGRKVVIDYKTGEVNPSQWFGERPDEPQLPLYSMAVDGDIAAVLFAQVKAGAMVFKGVAVSEGLVPGVKSYGKLRQTREANSWPEVLNDWQETMDQLGEDFSHGKALVDPKQYPGSCTYCELQPLCRIHELKALDDEPSDKEGHHE